MLATEQVNKKGGILGRPIALLVEDTPDYVYGHSVQASFEKLLKAQGGTSAGSLIPLGTPDYSAYLIQAKAYDPQVMINVMGGGDQVNSLKQFVQFGLDKQMAVAGTVSWKACGRCLMKRASDGGPWNGGGISRTRHT